MVVALVAAMAALLLLAYDANPAQAAGDCSTTSGTTTCTYGSTGAEDTFVVPEGVSSVHVVATGAPGAVGASMVAAPAGRGAVVSGNLTGLTPGQTLYVNVGGAPTGAGTTAAVQALTASAGSTVAGRQTPGGGGGGGASDVRTEI